MVGLIPPRAGAFQDRAERSRLRAAAAGAGTVVLCQVLTGMGGVGKTQLAADYAKETWADGTGVDLLVWVTASSRTAVVSEFAQAGAQVCNADLSDPLRAAHAFLTWLQTGRRRWLVVLDDVADPADLTGLWPPAVSEGRTVVTTRRRDAALAGGGRRMVDVGVFTPAQAGDYLASVLAIGGRVEPAGGLAGLAEDLGCLPLALSQAAAYVLDAGISVGEYRELLGRRARSLAEISPDVPPDDQAHSMAAAWELSVDYADRLRPRGLACPMLELAAFLAPNATPLTVLLSQPALDYLAAHRTPSPPGPNAAPAPGPGEPVTPQDATGALRALHRLSLLSAPDRAPAPVEGDADASGGRSEAAWDGRVVRVHQVVQRATRDTLHGDRYRNTAWAAADALLAAWPEVERDIELAQALRACTTALVTSTEEGADHAGWLYQPDAHPILYRLGSSLGESGQVEAATHHFHQLSQTTMHRLGPDHTYTLAARGHLAKWQGHGGDAAGAAAAFAALLDDQLRVLGPDHLHTLATRNSLATWRGQGKDAAGAAAAFAELLDDQLRVLGPDHPHTLATRSNLANWQGEAGDAAGAAAAFAALLDDQLRVLGPDHPDSLTWRLNLAYWRGKAGDTVGQTEIYSELINAQILDADHASHPDTLATRRRLAVWRGEAGDPAGAAAMFAELLDDLVGVLGPDHPDTLTARGSSAHWRGEAGDPAGAAAMFAALLDDQLRVLGPDHPDTLITRNNLAHWRGEAGDPAGAAAAFAALLDDQLRVLGPDHPYTLTTRNSLARWSEQAATGEA
ncbi:FxSxx-COOH system tetratricopeptide repeat protein [Actinacidiphila bryophytorum]|uniref:FxSxx-COOH system tetratricopeptide repeat protein n=1 Tax=Actinacidiphila bryophytorum TaxID=1436133 RepID=UPI001F12D599